MAENKTKATAQSVPAFLSGLEAAARGDAETLVTMIEQATGASAKIWGSAKTAVKKAAAKRTATTRKSPRR